MTIYSQEAVIVARRLLAARAAILGGQLPTYPSAYEAIAYDAFHLAELVQALDEWRRRGGFDPYDLGRPEDGPEPDGPVNHGFYSPGDLERDRQVWPGIHPDF